MEAYTTAPARPQPEREELTPERRIEMRACLMSHDANNALQFQAKAIKRYGAAAGVLCRELLFWDGKGHDPDGFVYWTKEEGVERMGLSAKSQDGARKVLEDAGVLEVERRPRCNADGRIIHPSVVLHYRLNLPVLFEQIIGESFNRYFKHADADARTRGSGDSSTRIGMLEHADKGAPYTEGTSEGTSEVTSEASLSERKSGPKEQKRRKYTKRDTHKKTTQESSKDDWSWLFNVNRSASSEHKPVEKLEDTTFTDKRHTSLDRSSEQKAAGEEDGDDARTDHEAPRVEVSSEPLRDHETTSPLAVFAPPPQPPEKPSIDKQERSKVYELVWNDPGDGAPKTVPGRFALAHVRGEKIDGVPVTARLVAEKVAAVLGDRHPVEAYIEPTEGALEYLRDELKAAVAT